MKALLLTLLLCYSCTKNATVSKDAVGIHIKPVQMEVSHLNEVLWSVGLEKDTKVTQSLTFIVDLPKINSSDLEYLTERKGINAWIIRVIADRGHETQDLGSLYALFKPKKVSRGIQGTGSITSVSIKIYYSAAYASERFRNFKCPAFGHNKKITQMKVQGDNEEFSLSIGQASPYSEKSHLVELSPSAFNGGNSLIGNYFIEIAAYDSTKKYIHSSFKRLPMYLSVSNEENVRISSCDGVHPELQLKEAP